MCVSIFGRSFSRVLAAGDSRLNGRQFKPILLSMRILGSG